MPRPRSPQHRAVGRVVRGLRDERGWSQWELADKAGVSLNYVGLLERGEVDPGLSKLAAFAKAFGLTAAELLQLADAARSRRA